MAAIKFLKQFILFLWQLPQNILGFVLYLSCLCFPPKTFVKFKNKRVFIHRGLQGGVSLGDFIFISELYAGNWDVVRHEYGHAIQSLILGPLYLIVVGIPSIVWAGLHKWTSLRKKDYYSFYTERWADKLGGVER